MTNAKWTRLTKVQGRPKSSILRNLTIGMGIAQHLQNGQAGARRHGKVNGQPARGFGPLKCFRSALDEVGDDVHGWVRKLAEQVEGSHSKEAQMGRRRMLEEGR